MSAPNETTDTARLAAEELAARIYAQRDLLPSAYRNPRFSFKRDDAEELARVAITSDALAWFMARAKAEALEEAADEIEPGTTFAEHPRAFLLGKAHRLRAAREDGAL